MFRKLSVISIFFLLIVSVAVSQSDVDAYKQTPEYKRARDFIRSKKNSDEYYYGDGTVNMGKEPGAAKEKARKRALEDLTSKIKVNIRSDITQTVTDKIGGDSKIKDERQVEINKLINIYSDQVLYEVETDYFEDYPRPGAITYCAWISKQKYREKVKHDLDLKKSRLTTAVSKGAEQLESGNVMGAVNNFILANNYLEEGFEGLPVQMDINGDGIEEEVKAYLDGSMIDIFSNMEMNAPVEKITYDIQGELTQDPYIRAVYYSPDGRECQVNNLPLKVDFLTGKGRVLGAVNTGVYGKASIRIRELDPSNRATVMNISVDKERLPGLDKFDLTFLPSVKMTLNKIKTIALAVSFAYGEKRIVPDELIIDLKGLLIENGFSGVEYTVPGNNVTAVELEQVERMNVDYLLVVNMQAGNAGTVGGYKNMYACTASGHVSLYSFPRGDQQGTCTLPGVRGAGVSSQGASMDCMRKLQKIAYTKSESMIKRL